MPKKDVVMTMPPSEFAQLTPTPSETTTAEQLVKGFSEYYNLGNDLYLSRIYLLGGTASTQIHTQFEDYSRSHNTGPEDNGIRFGTSITKWPEPLPNTEPEEEVSDLHLLLRRGIALAKTMERDMKRDKVVCVRHNDLLYHLDNTGNIFKIEDLSK